MMAVLGAFLGAVGLSDLFRAVDDKTSMGRRVGVAAIGLGVLALLLALGGTHDMEWLQASPLAIALLAWTFGSASALDAQRKSIARAVAFAGLAMGLVASTMVEADGQWPAALSGPIASLPYDRTILVVGIIVVQLATANVVVRLTLEAVGVPTAPGERRLKSGRVLGMMERLFIVGLGMFGAFTAAAAVVAAKGLLRYPDVKVDSEAVTSHERPNPISEYFLIGSFASWLIAVASLAVLGLDASLRTGG